MFRFRFTTTMFSSAEDRKRAITSATAQVTETISALFTRKYTLPTRLVGSQILLYRQLLAQKVYPTLRLSRVYEGTPAQRCVKDLGFWEKSSASDSFGDTNTSSGAQTRMAVSYKDLIERIWACEGGLDITGIGVRKDDNNSLEATEKGDDKNDENEDEKEEGKGDGEGQNKSAIIPSQFWVDAVGFQLPDPLTDFRSGGLLSLVLLHHVIETCPHVRVRFHSSPFPFALTSINVCSREAEMFLLSPSISPSDSLTTQKSYYRMFQTPDALFVVHECFMGLICDIVLEESIDSVYAFNDVFDTATAFMNDVLDKGPKNVEHFRSLIQKLRAREFQHVRSEIRELEKAMNGERGVERIMSGLRLKKK